MFIIFLAGKKCYIPRYVGEKMDMVRLNSLADYESLPLTKWKIKQPPDDDVREDALETGTVHVLVQVDESSAYN